MRGGGGGGTNSSSEEVGLMGGMLFIFLVYLFVVEMRRSSLRGSSVAKVNVNYNWDAMSMMILFI
jgi:hypothetical protein